MLKRHVVMAAVAVLALGSIGCGHTPTVRDGWTKVIRPCTSSDLFDDLAFFGQMNAVGPGSVWRQDSDKQYHLRFRLSDVVSDPQARSSVVQAGATSGCEGGVTSKLEVKLAVPVVASAIHLETGVEASLRSARSATVRTSAITGDLLVEGVYEQLLNGTGPPSPGWIEIQQGRLVMVKAIRVRDFTADFQFEDAVGAGLRARLPSGSVLALGPDGAQVTASWSTQGTLTVKSSGEAFIAVGFSRLVGPPATGAVAGVRLDRVKVREPEGGLVADIPSTPPR